jgi:hypothetical protein
MDGTENFGVLKSAEEQPAASDTRGLMYKKTAR